MPRITAPVKKRRILRNTVRCCQSKLQAIPQPRPGLAPAREIGGGRDADIGSPKRDQEDRKRQLFMITLTLT